MISNLETALLKFIALALQPLASVCIRRGIKIQSFTEASKRAFVYAATNELLHRDESVSASRLAVLTGLQRKDIARINKTQELSPKKPTLLSKIIGYWQSNKEYQDKFGHPRQLSYEGSNSEFSKLIREVSTDLNSYTIMFELERISAARREGNNLVLTTDTYVPQDDIDSSFALLANDIADLVIAVEDNLLSKEQKIPNFHASTHYDNVCVDDLPQIQRWFLETGAEFHSKARNYLSQYDKDLNPQLYDKQGGARVSIGSFSRITKKHTCNQKTNNNKHESSD